MNTSHYLEQELILEYKIEADPKVVYRAWTDIEIFKKWFYPTGFTVALAEMDPKEGGYFKIHMKSPEGDIYPTKGEYILLDVPKKIVYKDSWDDDRDENEPIILEIRFESEGDNTLLQLFSSFANEKQRETTLKAGVVEGWKMFFNNLNQLLKN